LSGKKSGKGATLAFFLILSLPFCGAAQSPGGAVGSGAANGGFPVIMRLDAGDTGFRQYIADVENNRRRLFSLSGGGRERTREAPLDFAESLTIYQYTPREGEDIFFLSARCNIPYSALASLNRLSHPVMLEAGRPLLLPSSPGLFIPAGLNSDLEKLLGAARIGRDTEAAELSINAAGRGGTFYFYPGADFNSTERAFFLDAGFRFPLRSYRLTSRFGIRQNPVTGTVGLHQGLDLAAPAGTEVFAAGEGVVTEIGEDSIYGVYLIIKHGESWASLYGHLQKVETTLRSSVQSGTLIGRVGSTGQSTGPHLHFELRQNGRARDPGKFLFQD
jgi:hypothetical protein